jgi:CubicO group peptidase (beta-lactamase class C family)
MIAGLIVEKVSGVPLLQFLEQSIFAPLGMKSAFDVDQTKLGAGDPMGYMRYGLGPARPAPKEGRGWLFAAGELAFTAEDLSKWDISIIDRSLLKPSSYSAFENEILLKNGLGSNYGLGVFVGSRFGHRALAHGGEVSGYTSENIVFPDDRAAIAVLTNQDAGDAAEAIANGIVPLLLAPDDPTGPPNLAGARMIFDGLQHGTIDRSLFTENANFYFSDQALKDFSSTLGPLGTPQEFTEINEALRGGMKFRGYSVKFANTSFRVWVYEMPDGKLEEYQVVPQE